MTSHNLDKMDLTIYEDILDINIVKRNKSTITALVFLVSFVFLLTNFISVSIRSDIINPIKNGI